MEYFCAFSSVPFSVSLPMTNAAVPNTSPSFESALQELEAIVQSMETGNAPLEESLAAYERGVALLRHCQTTLAAAEQKLQILENGVLRDFDASSAAGTES
jgi:exodeoxyribonuclease VII small subunit